MYRMDRILIEKQWFLGIYRLTNQVDPVILSKILLKKTRF